MDKTIYLISGLGADERIFDNLYIKDYSFKHIRWVEPKKNEPINEYANRLIAQIDTPKPIILGVSFGGIIAIEIGKIIECELLILISTIKTKYEIPPHFRVISKLKLHKIVPTKLLKQANFMTYYFFGMCKSNEKKLLKAILNDTNDQFLNWAINAILYWNNTIGIASSIHIHGTKDKILPSNFISKIDYKIPKGGHLMIYNMADRINNILANVLNT